MMLMRRHKIVSLACLAALCSLIIVEAQGTSSVIFFLRPSCSVTFTALLPYPAEILHVMASPELLKCFVNGLCRLYAGGEEKIWGREGGILN
jgi:hypothetical protein